MMGGYGGYGMGWFGGIIMIAFWALVIAGFVLLVRWLLASSRKTEGAGNGEASAQEILKRRYARGEIDKDEFERMKKDLR